VKGEKNMLRSLNELMGYELMAKDGHMGKVDDFFFNDEDWKIRYLVVDTGPWIFGKAVLISPEALLQPVWASETFPVDLTREQVKTSPEVDVVKPVSREYEEKLHEHYRWPTYWNMSPGGFGSPMYIPPNLLNLDNTVQEDGIKSQLRSATKVFNYGVDAIEGEVGSIKDFIIDDETWQVLYMNVDVSKWLEVDKQILVALDWIRRIDVSDNKVFIDLTQDAVRYSPKFDATLPVNRQYEEVIYDYYGRPKYWQIMEETEQK